MKAADVENKHIVVTGGASGIGAKTTELLASRGAKVFFGDRNVEGGKALSEALQAQGYAVEFFALDVTQNDSVKAFYAAAIAKFGQINVALNNAGVDHTPARMLDVPDEEFHRNIAINLTGVWYCMKQAIQHMLEVGGGHVINLASVAGVSGAPTISAYGASKHGVIGLTKSVAIEYARANIRVNAVCPSFVKTPMVETVLANFNEKQQNSLIGANPMKRLGEAEEIAYAIAWLCSDESSFMTGHSMVLDGGLTA
ncbi:MULTISPECIES: SDR family NAD(P)-dependent oxidoreductase [Alteromonadaceae]|uniref:SDR family NAD(P)-dependent oxidoreductase n=1 Tax=Alteromonadaceae TaxID=72275 RepID=UPI001C096B9E|nr:MULTISPECIES: glucose 1-dehydrogenase [Aliiglaciecola]MBU2877207.1 glucose 1-dehydrogenase [Aliiglaciecola lipolytica]MDO6712137.1 glucose 1-dehydrogenase [Aliiglaciecola sp. 2_MG-2023]MDO6753217.1 glucose 1-dehydrogenase [Aliiglaciecola sp. 1_MG-2023]